MTKETPAVDIRFQWSAGEVCFDCPCGEEEHIMSEGGDEITCKCGREYKLIHYVALIGNGKGEKK